MATSSSRRRARVRLRCRNPAKSIADIGSATDEPKGVSSQWTLRMAMVIRTRMEHVSQLHHHSVLCSHLFFHRWCIKRFLSHAGEH